MDWLLSVSRKETRILQDFCRGLEIKRLRFSNSLPEILLLHGRGLEADTRASLRSSDPTSALLILITEAEQDHLRLCLQSVLENYGIEEPSENLALLELGFTFSLHSDRVVFLDLPSLEAAGDHTGIRLLCRHGAMEKLLLLRQRLGKLRNASSRLQGAVPSQSALADMRTKRKPIKANVRQM